MSVDRNNLTACAGCCRHTPRDEIKSFSEWKALRAAANTPDESGNLPELNDPERLTDYRGLIVTFPRGFLANQQKRSLAESFLGELSHLRALEL